MATKSLATDTELQIYLCKYVSFPKNQFRGFIVTGVNTYAIATFKMISILHYGLCRVGCQVVTLQNVEMLKGCEYLCKLLYISFDIIGIFFVIELQYVDPFCR